MRTFTQLSYNEREKIYNGLRDGLTRKDIALMIGRSKSTVSREIRRNSDHIGYLYPRDAHELAQNRRNKNMKKLEKNKELQEYVVSKMEERWSPGTIYGSLKNSDSKPKNIQSVSKETIYSWIYDDKNSRSSDLIKLLIRSRKKRGLKKKVSKSKIKDRVSVHVRTDDINNRLDVGHYECDLIFNNGSQSKNVCTLVERVTRKAILIRNEDKRSSTVVDSIIDYINNNNLNVKSITFDNGSEFSEHGKFRKMGIYTFFCDPGAPWQKGGIENLNGLIRRYFPFKMNASEITHDYVQQVNMKINSMPRAILGYKTPNDLMKQEILKCKKNNDVGKKYVPVQNINVFSQKNLEVAFHS